MEQEESKILKLTEFVTANELANMMDIPVTQVIGTCMSIGMMVSINQRLDAETINLVAEEFGYKTEYVSAEVSQAITEEEDTEEESTTEPVDWIVVSSLIVTVAMLVALVAIIIRKFASNHKKRVEFENNYSAN